MQNQNPQQTPPAQQPGPTLHAALREIDVGLATMRRVVERLSLATPPSYPLAKTSS